jgi:hypothetical protein
VGSMRHQHQQEIVLPLSIDETYKRLERVGRYVGTVQESNELAKYFVIRLWPGGISNPATVRVSLKSISQSETNLSFQSDAFDGSIGFGSAGKAVDKIVRNLDRTDFEVMERRTKIKPYVFWLVIGVAIGVIGFIFLWDASNEMNILAGHGLNRKTVSIVSICSIFIGFLIFAFSAVVIISSSKHR